MTGSRIIAYFVLLSMAAACAKVEIVDRSPDEPVDFSWYSSRSSDGTRADSDYFVGGTTLGQERHLPEGTSFGVFGYFHPQYTSLGSSYAGGWNDGVNGNYPNLFYNEAVSISMDGLNYEYDYANSRYWPKNNLDRISFIAYYPWNELNTSGSASADAIVEPFLDSAYERDGMVGFYYTVPQASADQVDFMVSDLCLDQSWALWNANHSTGLTGSDNGKVKLFFHHALSQVRIKSVNFDTGDNDDVEVTINYIVFKNVAVFGQCIPVPDFGSTTATGRTTVVPTWPVSTLVARRPDLTTGVSAHVCYDSSSSTWNTEEILLMIPHTFFTGATIEVNFDVKRKKDSGTGEYYSYTSSLSAPLTTSTIYAWEAGRIYNYNITLDMESINVSADVSPWLDAGEDVIMDN